MRRGNLLLCTVALLIVLGLLKRCSVLISLLFEDGASDVIPRVEVLENWRVNSHVAEGEDRKTDVVEKQLIPKIIHQTYINSSLPTQWQQGQNSCIELHPDYHYILWTDETAREFIATEYPWFLPTFDGYAFPIQRADAIRYFVLAHFGGIYLDLDDGCNRSLDDLLQYPAWVRLTVPTGISNDAMGSVPGHPFFLQVIQSLESYDGSWVLPYITVMGTTGPLFLSVMWKHYISTSREGLERVRILLPAEYAHNPWSFFNITRGSSWHGSDAVIIFWMGRHWLALTISGFGLAFLLGMSFWLACGKCEAFERCDFINKYDIADKLKAEKQEKEFRGRTSRRPSPWRWTKLSNGKEEKTDLERIARMA